VARLLRHEVGDLLQSVYSTVALLIDRLREGMAQERRLLSDLKCRAEVCRDELDVTVDLLSPPGMTPGKVELQAALAPAIQQARRRYPGVPLVLEIDSGLTVNADVRALIGALTFLLAALCHAARKPVKVRLTRDGETACCAFEREGVPVSDEQLTWLERPFATTQQALLGLALANTRRVVEFGGGSLSLSGGADGGLCVRLLFPVIGA